MLRLALIESITKLLRSDNWSDDKFDVEIAEIVNNYMFKSFHISIKKLIFTYN